MATLGSVFALSYLSTGGGSKKPTKEQGPPLNAGSSDEEKFIR